jgi:FlaA1/EpsC-like NDP-sugar epimerase
LRSADGTLRSPRLDDCFAAGPDVLADATLLAPHVRGTTVLVTGAGGAIGGALAERLLDVGPARLVLLGHGEHAIWDVTERLAGAAHAAGATLVPMIADVRDGRRMQAVFAAERPSLVLHAAAHKHVPLMERHVGEAIRNNVEGTVAVLDAAESAHVARVVVISTDKAVAPVSVLGATKLLAERLVCEAGRRLGRPWCTVRFGNVLGTRGSVVPLFERQIAAGGPVEVTSPAMRRYFVTMPDAVERLLHAAAVAVPGERFTLEMSAPIAIADLAALCIRLAGKVPGVDVPIRFGAPRPGEKTFEVLCAPDETLGEVRAPGVRAVITPIEDGVRPVVDSLVEAARALGDEGALRDRLFAAAASSSPLSSPA